MGDFSLIHQDYGFDPSVYDYEEEKTLFAHSEGMVTFTYLLFIMCVFYLFMIFMNFIIAVIGESYSKVITKKEAFDYQQRAMMIYEREVHFRQNEFENDSYFPNFLLVKKMKQSNDIIKNTFQGFTSMVKSLFKVNYQRHLDHLTQKTKDMKQHLINSIKPLENDIHNINRDFEKVFYEVQKISTLTHHPFFAQNKQAKSNL